MRVRRAGRVQSVVASWCPPPDGFLDARQSPPRVPYEGRGCGKVGRALGVALRGTKRRANVGGGPGCRHARRSDTARGGESGERMLGGSSPRRSSTTLVGTATLRQQRGLSG